MQSASESEGRKTDDDNNIVGLRIVMPDMMFTDISAKNNVC